MRSIAGIEISPELEQYEDAAWSFAENSAAWMAENLVIIDRMNNLVPLVANKQQLEVLFWAGMQLAARAPVRMSILKSRRMGISTIITALGFMMVRLTSNYPAFACAHDQEGTDTMFHMVQLFEEHLPPQHRLATDYSNKKEIIFSAPHSSSYRFHTAGSKGLGRSKEITFLHISEKAFINHFGTVAGGIMSCVPKSNPMSFVFEESTANGASGDFYDDWKGYTTSVRKAPAGLDGTLRLFFSWLDFPEYRKPLGDVQLGRLDEAELKLRSLGADDEQLYFRRFTIAEDYNGDADMFAQEYPATPDEAFLTSGRPAIPNIIIARHKSLAKDPIGYVHLVRDGEQVVPVDADSDIDCWAVWEEPRERFDYTVGGDVAEGGVSDMSNPKSTPDFHAGFVLNRKELSQAAEYLGQKLDAEEWGRELRKCAEWYNHAYASPEANAVGQAAITAFKDYPNVYQRQNPTDCIDEMDRPFLGFKTTSANRDYIIDTWLAYSRPNPSGRDRFEGKIQIYSERLIEQELTFVRKKTGRREHQDGCFDDLLFAAFIALQIHLDCPRDIPTKPPKPYLVPGIKEIPSHMFVGGVWKKPKSENFDHTF